MPGKPAGKRPMTAAERQAKRREQFDQMREALKAIRDGMRGREAKAAAEEGLRGIRS